MDEFSFIKSIKPKTWHQPTLVKGIGDDAAVFRHMTKNVVTAVDTFVENVHFSQHTMTLFQVGYRALAANISDLAAMGASPAFYLASVVVPNSLSMPNLHKIFSGMNAIAQTYNMDLIGGDMVAGESLTLSITVIGFVDEEKARYRNMARDGDIVFVTGTLGDAQAGYHILTHDGDYKNKSYYIHRHRMPTPRVDFARALSHLDRIALNDVSDGLANEAAEIVEASGVDICLYADNIPVSPSFSQFSSALQRKWKLFGGEDFELLGTVAADKWPDIEAAAETTNTSVTEIGRVMRCENETGRVYLYENAQKKILNKDGYTHFK
ncbi:MAG TPA: thiamine-phosphate kinase [Bacillota bacterium]|nr:thiamine-phosphate kinase [Bacillota bacterium]